MTAPTTPGDLPDAETPALPEGGDGGLREALEEALKALTLVSASLEDHSDLLWASLDLDRAREAISDGRAALALSHGQSADPWKHYHQVLSQNRAALSRARTGTPA